MIEEDTEKDDSGLTSWSTPRMSNAKTSKHIQQWYMPLEIQVPAISVSDLAHQGRSEHHIPPACKTCQSSLPDILGTFAIGYFSSWPFSHFGQSFRIRSGMFKRHFWHHSDGPFYSSNSTYDTLPLMYLPFLAHLCTHYPIGTHVPIQPMGTCVPIG